MRTLMDEPVSDAALDREEALAGIASAQEVLDRALSDAALAREEALERSFAEEMAAAAPPVPVAPSPSVINDNVYLAYVSVHMPRLNFKVRGAAVEVNGVVFNKSQATEPQWKLLPDEHTFLSERVPVLWVKLRKLRMSLLSRLPQQRITTQVRVQRSTPST